MPRPKKTDNETETENAKSQLSKSPFSKGETVCLTYKIDGKPKYYITSTTLRDVYYLYESVPADTIKIIKTKYKADNPVDLYKFRKV